MSNALYAALADAKTKGSRDGDYIEGDQQGLLILHGVKDISKALKKTAILTGEILEAHPKKAGAFTQRPGTCVKKLYLLSKYDFHLDMLKTDLVNITGSPADMGKDELAGLFEQCFEKGGLKGVVVKFDSRVIDRSDKGKQPIVEITFKEPDGPANANGTPAAGHINAPDKVKERAAKIPDMD